MNAASQAGAVKIGATKAGATKRNLRPARWFLVFAILITILAYVVPYGWVIGYPMLLVSTLAHELGHGMAALAVGGDFSSLVIYPDGSGMASLDGIQGRLAAGIVAAGGLMGPALFAALLFVLSIRPRRAQIALIFGSLLLGISGVLVVRNLFGWLFVGALALTGILLGSKASARVAQLATTFMGVELALSIFARADYLFTPTAMTAAGSHPSDVGLMAAALFLPYWFWGALCGFLSVAITAYGLRLFWQTTR